MSGFNKLPIGIDLDGTAFQHPEFFAELLRVWEGKTYALTARQESKNTLNICDNLGLRFNEYIWDLCDNEAKSQKCKS